MRNLIFLLGLLTFTVLARDFNSTEGINLLPTPNDAKIGIGTGGEGIRVSGGNLEFSNDGSTWKLFPVLTPASNGQILIGSGTNYVNGNLTGTANQVTVTEGAGTLGLSLPQNIHTAADPTFDLLTLSNNLLFSVTSPLIHTADTGRLTLFAGPTPGTANTAQIILSDNNAGVTPAELLLAAGSGASGAIKFNSGGQENGSLNNDGKWTIGTGGGTQTHVANGNLHLTNDLLGSGSGTFAGALQVGTNVNIQAQGDLRLQDSDNSAHVALQANATTTTYTLTMPAGQCAADQVMINDGSGNLSCSDVLGGGGGDKVFISQNTFDSDSLLSSVTCTVGTCSISNSAPLVDRSTKYLAVSLAAQTANVRGGVANTAWVDKMLSVSCAVKSSLTDLSLCAYNGTADEQCALYTGAGAVQQLTAAMGYNTGETPQWRFKTDGAQTDTFEADNCTVGELITESGTKIYQQFVKQSFDPASMTSATTGTLRFGTITFSGDTLLTYTDANGRFTNNSSSKVKFDANFTGRATNAHTIGISVNGTVANRVSNGSTSQWSFTGTTVNLSPGDYVEFTTNETLTSGVTQWLTIAADQVEQNAYEFITGEAPKQAAGKWGVSGLCEPALGTTTAGYAKIADSDCTFTKTYGDWTALNVSNSMGAYKYFSAGPAEVCFSGSQQATVTADASYVLELFSIVGCAGTTSTGCASNTYAGAAVRVYQYLDTGTTIPEAAQAIPFKACINVDLPTPGNYTFELQENTQVAGTVSNNLILGLVDAAGVSTALTIEGGNVATKMVGTFKPAVNAVSAWATTNQTGIAYSSDTKVNFDTEVDPDGLFDLATETLTIPEDGMYTLDAALLYQDLSGSFYDASTCNFKINGSSAGYTFSPIATSAGIESPCAAKLTAYLNKNDTVTFQALHYYVAGGRVILGNANKPTRFSMVKADQAGVINKMAAYKITTPNVSEAKTYFANINCDAGSLITPQTFTGTATIGNISGGACVVTIPSGNFTDISRVGCSGEFTSGVGDASKAHIEIVYTSTTSLTIACGTDTGSACSSFDTRMTCTQY